MLHHKIHQPPLYNSENGVKEESIIHESTGHFRTCVVTAIRCNVTHLQQHGAPRNAHLASVFNVKRWSTVIITNTKSALHASTKIIGLQVGFTTEDDTVNSMRAIGSMVLLISHVDTDTIRLVGRWRSDAMLWYVHTTAHNFTSGLVVCMVQNGDYTIITPAYRG